MPYDHDVIPLELEESFMSLSRNSVARSEQLIFEGWTR